MTSEESIKKKKVYLLLMVINKFSIVSHNNYSWVIFLERRWKKTRKLILWFIGGPEVALLSYNLIF